MEHHLHFPQTQATLIDALDQSLRQTASRPASREQIPVCHVQDRLLSLGGETLDDVDLLELALGRGRALPLRLIERFGDFGTAISAPEKRLREVSGMDRKTIAALKLIEAAAHRLARTKILNRQVLDQLGPVAGLLPHRHGASGCGTVSHPVSGQ